MTKLVLAFAVLSSTFGVIHSGRPQRQDSSVQLQNDQSQNEAGEELGNDYDRRQLQSYASANAIGSAGGAGGYGPNQSNAFSHECLACVGCPEPLNTTAKQCTFTLDPYRLRKCVVYGERYNHMKDPWVVRGCASERGSCADIKAAHAQHRDIVTLHYCRECEGDKCNDFNGAGIPHSLPDLFMAFLAMVVTPVITKYTMS